MHAEKHVGAWAEKRTRKAVTRKFKLFASASLFAAFPFDQRETKLMHQSCSFQTHRRPKATTMADKQPQQDLQARVAAEVAEALGKTEAAGKELAEAMDKAAQQAQAAVAAQVAAAVDETAKEGEALAGAIQAALDAGKKQE